MNNRYLMKIQCQLEAFDLGQALNEVSPERRAYAMGYRYERDRRLSVAVYLLLKEALRQRYGITENPRIKRLANGKPYLADYPEIHFSLSHCAKAAVAIVADSPVGIDVEEIASVDWQVARRVLSSEELAEVGSSKESDVAFANYWTRKEAFVKLTGDGIEEGRLANVLTVAKGCEFETLINREHGFVVSIAAEGNWR